MLQRGELPHSTGNQLRIDCRIDIASAHHAANRSTPKSLRCGRQGADAQCARRLRLQVRKPKQQPNTEHVAGLAYEGYKKPNLLIDWLRRSRFLLPIGLKLEDCRFIDVDQYCVAEKPYHVADCIFGERDPSKAQSVICQIFIGHMSQPADSIFPPVLNVVEAVFEFTAPLVLGVFGYRFGS